MIDGSPRSLVIDVGPLKEQLLRPLVSSGYTTTVLIKVLIGSRRFLEFD